MAGNGRTGRDSLWLAAAMVVLSQWPLCAMLVNIDVSGLTPVDYLGCSLLAMGVILWLLGCRGRAGAVGVVLAAMLLTAAAYLGLRNAPLALFLGIAAGMWLVTTVSLIRPAPTAAKFAFLLTIFLAGGLLAELLVGRLSFSPKQAPAVSSGSFQGQIEIPDREALAQLLPSSSVRAAKTRSDGTVDFDVHYNVDSRGSRVTPGRPEHGPEWYFFGCSFTFGEGLEDNQTITAQLQKLHPEARVFNFSIRNLGTSDSWIHLKRRIDSGEKPRWCVYCFIEDHFRRAGLPDVTVATEGTRPRVVVESGRPVLVGSAERTIGSPWEQFRINLIRRSRVVRALSGSWRPDDRMVELVVSLGGAMKEQAERSPGGRFLFVVLPERNEQWPDRIEQVKAGLRRRGVDVLACDDLIREHVRKTGQKEASLYFADGHPRPEYAAMVAQWVSERVGQQSPATQAEER